MFLSNTEKYTGKIVNRLDTDGVTVSTSHYSDEESLYDWHYHESPHICFVFQGDYFESSRRLNKQSVSGISFYHAGETHRWISRTPISKSANIEISGDFFNKYDFEESQIGEAVNNNLDGKLLMLKIQQEMWFDDVDGAAAIQTLLLELIAKNSKSIYDSSVPNWVLVLYNLLNDRWDEQLTLNELSTATDVHPITISKHFRKYFSCTLGEYLRKLKIDRSIPLIKNSELLLTEIAFQCGFADQSHFTRTFKQITGLLPKDFRNI